jgi:hypothetical protein
MMLFRRNPLRVEEEPLTRNEAAEAAVQPDRAERADACPEVVAADDHPGRRSARRTMRSTAAR